MAGIDQDIVAVVVVIVGNVVFAVVMVIVIAVVTMSSVTDGQALRRTLRWTVDVALIVLGGVGPQEGGVVLRIWVRMVIVVERLRRRRK